MSQLKLRPLNGKRNFPTRLRAGARGRQRVATPRGRSNADPSTRCATLAGSRHTLAQDDNGSKLRGKVQMLASRRTLCGTQERILHTKRDPSTHMALARHAARDDNVRQRRTANAKNKCWPLDAPCAAPRSEFCTRREIPRLTWRSHAMRLGMTTGGKGARQMRKTNAGPSTRPVRHPGANFHTKRGPSTRLARPLPGSRKCARSG